MFHLPGINFSRDMKFLQIRRINPRHHWEPQALGVRSAGLEARPGLTLPCRYLPAARTWACRKPLRIALTCGKFSEMVPVKPTERVAQKMESSKSHIPYNSLWPNMFTPTRLSSPGGRTGLAIDSVVPGTTQRGQGGGAQRHRGRLPPTQRQT